uniref:Uncharacterized protein n=1 Tax=Cucumis melo TaxID=3656 RepID=A0A9I9EEW2_CUCME
MAPSKISASARLLTQKKFNSNLVSAKPWDQKGQDMGGKLKRPYYMVVRRNKLYELRFVSLVFGTIWIKGIGMRPMMPGDSKSGNKIVYLKVNMSAYVGVIIGRANPVVNLCVSRSR